MIIRKNMQDVENILDKKIERFLIVNVYENLYNNNVLTIAGGWL